MKNRLATMMVLAAVLVPSFLYAEQCAYHLEVASNPERAIEYEMTVKKAKDAHTSGYGEYQAFRTVKLNAEGGEQVEVDELSYNCMMCHDGTIARSHNTRIRSAEQRTGLDMNKISSHPIGVHYGSAAYINRSLKSLHTLNEAIVLVNGQLGCLSCHDISKGNAKHLVMENRGSILCMQCHAK